METNDSSGRTGWENESADSVLRGVAHASSVSLETGETRPTHLEGAGRPGTVDRKLSAGVRVGERFETIAELGRGGFGAVFLARDLELGRHVAVKVMGLGAARALSDTALTLFEREARATARLNHPNIVTVFDWGTYQGLPYLVLERLKGEPLSARLERGPLGAADAVAAGIQIARGLAHAHEAGVLHLDLKPHNVFVCEDGLVKILDLGLAQLDPSGESLRSALQQSPSVVHAALGDSPVTGGTPAYMAPEQWRGEPLDERTDLWAVGVMLFEMLTGQLPFRVTSAGSTATGADPAPPVSDHVPAVPAELATLVTRCLEKQRDDRIGSAAELLDSLHAVELSLAGPAADTEQPYRYLEPFTEADAAWFFGRDREARRLMGMLENRPLVAVVGPSGAGKSSLVMAGLIPRLRRGPQPWTVIALRPGSNPLQLLESRLSELNGEVTDLGQRPGLAGQVLRAHARAAGKRVLLYVDQFEELFTHVGDPRARQAFAAALLSAADDPQAPVRVVISVRGDFLGELGEQKALRDQVSANNLILSPPDADAMTEALREPAQRLGYDFDDGLAAEMVRALEQEAAPLPLLQLAASRLWEKRDAESRLLTRRVLHALGGVPGVLAAHAEEVLQQIPGEQEQWIAREIFLHLVTAEGTRRPMDREALLEIFEDESESARILEHLLRGRLLTSSKRDGKAWVELAHEALVQRWDRLGVWLADEKDHRLFHERVTQAAANWDEQGRPRNLLWTKKAYDRAAEWRDEFRGALAPVEIAFLDACESRERRRRRNRRILLVAAVVAAIAGAIGTLLGVRAYRAAAHAAWVSSVVRAAAQTNDPLLGALLLSELADEKEPPGGLAVARRVASRAIPLARFKGRGAVSPDRSRVVVLGGDPSASYNGYLNCTDRRLVHVWRTDGKGPPVSIRTPFPPCLGFGPQTFGPDGARFVVGSQDGLAGVFRTDGSGTPVILRGHRDYVEARMSPRGDRILTVSADFLGMYRGDGTARVWRTDGRFESPALKLPRDKRFSSNGFPWAHGFSPDGNRVFFSAWMGGLQIRPVDDLRRSVTIRAGALGTPPMWSPDGSRVYTTWGKRAGSSPVPRLAKRAAGGGNRGATGLPATEAKGPIFFGPKPPKHYRDMGIPLAISSDGKRLLVAWQNDGVTHVLPTDGSSLGVALRSETGTLVSSSSFSPDGRWVVARHGRETVGLYRSDGSGKPIPLWVGADHIIEVLFSRDGSRVFTVSGRETRVWPARGSGEPLRFRFDRGNNPKFNRDLTLVARVQRSSPRVVVVERTDGSGVVRLLRHDERVANWVFLPDGRVVTRTRDYTRRIWRLAPGSSPAILPLPKGRLLVNPLPGGQTLASLSPRLGQVLLYRLGAAQPYLRLPLGIKRAPGKWRYSLLRLSSDGSHLALVDQNTVRVWRTDRVNQPRVVRHPKPVHMIRYASSPSRMVTWTRDTTYVWSPDGERLLAKIPGGLKVLNHSWLPVAISPDGKWVLNQNDETLFQVWRLPSDRSMGRGFAGELGQPVVLPHPDPASAAFSPDGRTVLTCAQHDGTCRIWPVDGRRAPEVLTMAGEPSIPSFSRDGSRLYVQSTGGNRIFRLGWKNVVAYLRSATTACLGSAERKKHLGEDRATARSRFVACEARYGRPALE